jgi:hypothetical protein
MARVNASSNVPAGESHSFISKYKIYNDPGNMNQFSYIISLQLPSASATLLIGKALLDQMSPQNGVLNNSCTDYEMTDRCLTENGVDRI